MLLRLLLFCLPARLASAQDLPRDGRYHASDDPRYAAPEWEDSDRALLQLLGAWERRPKGSLSGGQRVPAMRRFRALALFVCVLSLAAWAGSPFELLPGHWEGKPEGVEAPPSYLFEVGPGANRRFTVARLASTETDVALVAAGSYEVTANKGQPHVSLMVERIYSPDTGEDQDTADFSGWKLETGHVARVIMDFEDTRTMVLDTFDPESLAFLIRFRMHTLGAPAP